MKTLLRQLFDFLIFTNIFIAICAVAQGWLTYMLLAMPVDYEILLLLFMATLFVYNAQAVLNKIPKDGTSVYYRVDWLIRHRRVVRGVSFSAAVIVLVLLPFLKFNTWLALGFTGILAICYSFPVLKNEGLRQLPGIKLFLIAGVWASASVLIPYVESDSGIPLSQILILGCKRFLFITAITLPFDIKDIETDKAYGLKTMATLLGEKKSKIFSLLLLCGYLILLYFYQVPFTGHAYIGLLFTILLSALLIVKSSTQQRNYYYLFFFDGILLLQPILVWVSGYF